MYPLRSTLHTPAQAHSIWVSMWHAVKQHLAAGRTLQVEVSEETRRSEQNRKFHAICEDFARSGLEWAGKRRNKDEWKVLLVSGHAVVTKLGADMVPGLEGEFVNLRESTARMSVSRMSSLIDYSLAFGAQRGVEFRNA